MFNSLFLTVVRFYSKEFLAYPLETLMSVIRRTLMVALLLLFWYLIDRDNDVEALNIVPYILIAGSVQFLTLGHNFKFGGDIAASIKTGQLNNLIIRPMNTIQYLYGAWIGRGFIEILFSAVTFLIGITLLDSLSPVQLGMFFASLIPAVIIALCINVLVGAAAFWITEIHYLRITFFFATRIVSGMYIPLTFFSGVLGTVLLHLPFAQIAFVPGGILTGLSTQESLRLLLIGVAWSVIMILFARWAWNVSIRRYSAVGI